MSEVPPELPPTDQTVIPQETIESIQPAPSVQVTSTSSPVPQEKPSLPALQNPRKSLNIQGFQNAKSQSESPFLTRNKSSKQRNTASTSVKLDKIDEASFQAKGKPRLNRSISPGMNSKSNLKNTLNQQNGSKPGNAQSSQKLLKIQGNSDKNAQKGLSSTLKLNSTITTPQSNQQLAVIPEQSKSLLFQSQRLQGSQLVLVPKNQNPVQQLQAEAKLAAQRKPQTSGNLGATTTNPVASNNQGIAPQSETTQLKYYLGGGNNSERIRKLLNKREGWSETKDATSMFVNFKWQQTTRGYKYEKLVDNNNYKQVVNHFEFHREISNKQYLVKNLMSYAESIKQNVFEITPLTYVIDFNEDNCDIILNNFLKSFEMNMPQHIKKKQTNLQAKANDIRKLMRQFQAQYGNSNSEKMPNQQYTKWSLQDTFLDQDNGTFMWLLKPTFLNRGRGIHVFNSLQSLEKLISDYTAGFEEKIMKKSDKKEEIEDQQPVNDSDPEKEDNKGGVEEQKKDVAQKENQQQQANSPPVSQTVTEVKKVNQNGNSFQIKKIKPVQQGPRATTSVNNHQNGVKKEKEDPNKYIRAIPTGPCILKASQFVIQKYIEKPLLINNRKFDIRVWALVSHTMDAYFFREGYMRLSSSEFSTDESQLDNLFIHLTNNAIQKYSDSYGQYENGNMWTFNKLWEFLEKYYDGSGDKQPASYYKEKIVQKIKDVIFITFSSVKKKINQFDRKICFEMFGFDFLIDSELNTWLIEVNTNPAIEECSAVTSALIPRALDDAFKLTIDQIFPKRQQQQQNINKAKEEQDKDAGEEKSQAKTTLESDIPLKNQQSINQFQKSEKKSNEETFPIPGYEDDFNMWELLGNLRETQNVDLKKKNKNQK